MEIAKQIIERNNFKTSNAVCFDHARIQEECFGFATDMWDHYDGETKVFSFVDGSEIHMLNGEYVRLAIKIV